MTENPILRYFDFAHLPAHLQEVARGFHDLAHHIAETLPPGPEASTALRKLLEGRGAAVRAALDIEVTE